MQGCLGGVGVGVDDNNIITALRPGHPAHACGLMELGDRVISIDGVRLAYKGQVWKLAQVMKRSSMHIFGVERRLWEEDEDGNRIPDEDEEPETWGVFQSDVVEPAAVAVADNDDDQPMGSSLAEPGITWQGVAIEITVQVPAYPYQRHVNPYPNPYPIDLTLQVPGRANPNPDPNKRHLNPNPNPNLEP